jgi:hypothetical protein
MTEPNTLIYPTIDLFLYDLAEGLGQSDNAIAHNRENFWLRIYGDQITVDRLYTAAQAELELSGNYSGLNYNKEMREKRKDELS